MSTSLQKLNEQVQDLYSRLDSSSRNQTLLEERCAFLETKNSELEKRVASLDQAVSTNIEEATQQTQKIWADVETVLVIILLVLAYYLTLRVLPPEPVEIIPEQQMD